MRPANPVHGLATGRASLQNAPVELRVTGTKCVKHRVSVCLSFCARWRGGGRRKGEGRCDVFAVRGAGRRGACDDTKALGCRFSLSLIRPT